jgi:hypothetical protein
MIRARTNGHTVGVGTLRAASDKPPARLDPAATGG